MTYHNSFKQLEIYKIARKLSAHAWAIYTSLPKNMQYHMGDQILRSADSVGANIAEGHGRFHFKDQIRFLYNSRGSLIEVIHWTELLFERELIDQKTNNYILNLLDELLLLNLLFLQNLR